MTFRSPRARAATAGLALLAVAAAPALAQLPASAEDATSRSSLLDPDSFVTLGDTVAGLDDITTPLRADGSALVARPSAAQLAAAAALPAGVTLRWNDSGTPATISTTRGPLAPSTGQGPEASARAWLTANRSLLGLGVAQVRSLELVSTQPLGGDESAGAGHAVLLRQRFGDLAPATRSMVTVGVARDGSIAFVSSSLTKAQAAPPAAVLTPLTGWLAAAANVGRTLDATELSLTSGPASLAEASDGGWSTFRAAGFDQAQRARLRAFARPDGVVRPVIEANVVDTTAGTSFAYRVLVDAVTGDVLFRQNAVENSNDAFPFQGTYTPLTCSQAQPFELTDDKTRTIGVVAAAVVAADDITIRLAGPSGSLGEFDLLTSPETATYTAPGGGTLPAGTYTLQVCPFDATAVGGPYTATVVTSDQGGPDSGSVVSQPRWRAFAANPALSTIAQSQGFSPDKSIIECWTAGTEGCAPGEAHENIFSFGAWDQIAGAPTFTTIGNNANTHEAWGSFLTPGGAFQAPISPVRDYTTPFTDQWNNSRCDTASFASPSRNDIDAVTGNLFVGHNRIHDFSYGLGFTERNYNLQLDNSGRGGIGGDQEIGNVQAGAVTGGAPTYMGRDNANQIALQDGVPGITNQYLFQPIAAAFYSPCTDGALDTGIYGHEYTHAISNRMVGGPDDGLTSEQGGAMGESWSDLVAAEYQFENDYLSDTAIARNPWSLGSYTTGNFAKGIRDYAINDNPLNYSDYGFDITGAEVHADGEIWNGTLWEVRQALVEKWNARFPYADKALQERCEQPTADPTRPMLGAESCPGNRRWLQLVFDSFLLQQGATDMLQARDAMLAADRMRFGGANQAVIAAAFARRGMGVGASTPTPDSEDVTPSFRSSAGRNSSVVFTSTSPGAVYVGNYEARVTPVARTAANGRSARVAFTPGVYRMTFVSPTKGVRRFVLTVPASGAPVTSRIDDAATNVASAAAGATLIGATPDSLNAAALIDGTEATNWSGSAGGENVDDAAVKPSVAVALAGGLQTISSAKVSALLRPSDPDPNAPPVPLAAAADPDPLAGSRFTALRRFALERCVSNCTSPTARWARFFTSRADAFPGDIPRPVAPDLTLRSFSFAPVQAAAVRLVALENQCTGQAKYAGEQDADLTNATDCKTASERGQVVHAAELQVFSGSVPADPAQATAGDGRPGSGTAGQGTNALPVSGQATIG